VAHLDPTKMLQEHKYGSTIGDALTQNVRKGVLQIHFNIIKILMSTYGTSSIYTIFYSILFYSILLLPLLSLNNVSDLMLLLDH
jgi:hypothetical protein